jgi:hypothetical protein
MTTPSALRHVLRLTWSLTALLVVNPLIASASTELPEEHFTALEFGAGNFALIDKATGQVRVGTVSVTQSTSFAPTMRTHQPDVSAVAAGFHNGVVEQLVLASPTANRAMFAPVDGSPTTPYFPRQPGPAGISLYRKGLFTPDRLLLHSLYGPASSSPPYEDDYLESTEDANLGSAVFNDEVGGLLDLAAVQPLYLDSKARREAAAVWDSLSAPTFLLIYDDSGSVDSTFSDPLPAGTKLATNVLDVASNLMVVGFVPGSKSLTLITIDTGVTPWEPVAPFPTDAVPFKVGTVAATSGLAGAPDGILLTSHDGTQAAFGEIVAGGTQVNILQTFTNSLGLQINALVPIPGRGIMRFEGPGGGRSTNFVYDAWKGAQFATKDFGVLPPVLPAQTSFATILWYDAEPLVNLNAKLLQLDTEPDWTNGTGALPAALTKETYVDQTTGLANPLAIAPPSPGGAVHVLTNQLLDTCSLAVLKHNAALLDPSLTVDPPSGSFDDTILIQALADSDYEILYREDRAGSTWRTYEFAFGIGYPSTWQFYAKHLSTGDTGPIASRTYTFPLANLLEMDADKDSVPDFVEQYLGLSATGGSDSDNDLQSDLEEIIDLSALDGDAPNDPNQFTPAASRNAPFAGEGFLLIAEAFDTTTGKASPGEAIEVRNMAGAVLDSANVEVLTSPPALVGELGANLTINTLTPQRHWAVLNSPIYFDLGTAPPEPRDGREVYRLLQVPNLALPTINPALVGNNLEADAQAWIAAAQAAYLIYEPVTAISELHPLDTTVSAIGEAALYDALLALDHGAQTALGVPQTIPADPGPPTPEIPGYSLFTLFGDRDGDAERTPFSEEMLVALESAGLSFANLLTLIEVEVNGVSPQALALRDVTDAIYDHHVANSDTTPLMPLPLDVLRLLVRGQAVPSDYDPMAGITPSDLTDARTAISAILTQLSTAYRPVSTITVEVGPPTVPGQAYGYTNINSTMPVVFLDQFGDLFTLDQGLGIAHTTLISVQGYTDVTGPAGHEAIEALVLTVLSIPQPSDTDANANLLDDDWEGFFFGGLGVVGPFDLHPANGFTYLQLFLIGHDPRCEDTPSEALASLNFPVPEIVVLANSNYGLQFEFPDEYFDNFEWSLQESAGLMTFNDLTGAVFQALGGNHYVVDVGAAYSSFVRRFFRIGIALP